LSNLRFVQLAIVNQYAGDESIFNDPERRKRHLMRTPLPTILATTFLLGSSAVGAQQAPLPTVASLDLDRYAGTWHEIARYPNFFERMCARDVTAQYTRNQDGTIAVVNSCRKEDGTTARADGVARVVAPAKLEVRFAPAWLSFLPFVWGDYWVIDLAPDYSYSVVGAPGRDYLWILARSPQLDDATMAAITAKLPALGFDPARLVKSPPS
jgi:apolipoprotein D and lipocalin family protein